MRPLSFAFGLILAAISLSGCKFPQQHYPYAFVGSSILYGSLNNSYYGGNGMTEEEWIMEHEDDP